MFTCLFLSLAAASGQSLLDGIPAGGFSLRAPLVDHDAESGVWARGSNWKLNVRPDGAAFYPLSSGQDRHRPLEFGAPVVTVGGRRIEARAGQESVDDLAILVDRGAFRERWHLTLGEVEQTFEFDVLPRLGELVIDLPLATDWSYRGRDAGLRFEIEGMGDARYGDVTTRDAAGRMFETESEFLGDRIRLRVPESFLSVAEFPVVVDPTIEFLVLESGSIDVHDPSSTYDPVSDRYLVVFSTRHFYGDGDADLLGYYVEGDGDVVAQVALDLTTNRALTPSAGHLAFTSYFPVAYVNISVIGVNSIRVRFLGTSTTSVGPAFTPKTGDYCNSPNIAGSITDGVSKVFVTWAEGNILNPWNKIKSVTISNLGVYGASTTIASGGEFVFHSVTATDGAFGRWAVVWVDASNTGSVILNGRLFDSRTAQPVGNTLFFGSNGRAIKDPVVAGDGQTFVCLWERFLDEQGDDSVIFARKLKLQSGTLATDGPMIDFTALDAQNGGAVVVDPLIARDGGRYVYAGNVGTSGIAIGTFVPTTSGIQLLEQDQPVPTYGSNLYRGDITTEFESGGEVGRGLVSWCPRDGGEVGLEAALYQSAVGAGGVAIAQTGCGGIGIEPQISFSGQLSLVGGTSTVNLSAQPFSDKQIWIGTPLSWQLCSACPFGVSPTEVVVGTSATFVNGTHPSLVGTQIAIQGTANEPLFGTKCTNLAGTTFQTSDTLIVTLQ